MTPSKTENNTYKYKISEEEVSVAYGQNVKTWSVWDGTADITAETGKNITVVECNAEYQAMKAGTAVVTARA